MTQPWGRMRKLAWLLKTHGLKARIDIEERFGLFSYRRWISQNEPGPLELATQCERLEELAVQPVISVILTPVTGDTTPLVARTLASLQGQTYPHWQVGVPEALFTEPDNSYVRLPSELKNALSTVIGEWVLFLSAGDTLSPHAFYAMVSALQTNPQAEILYSDEDRLAADGVSRHSPFCKPDFSPALLLSVNYLRGAFFRRERLLASASVSASSGESLLRCVEGARNVVHIPHILLHRHSRDPENTKGGWPTDGDYVAFVESAFTVDDRLGHLRRRGVRDPQGEATPQGTRFTWGSSHPLVSIIITSKDHVGYLQRCISSILGHTDYPHFEIIIVDNDSQAPATLAFYTQLPPQARVLYNHEAFNYSAYNNRGAQAAHGDLLLFLNNDVEIVESHWLDELVRWAELPDVGIVSGKLLYPDGTVQHVGTVVGMEGHGSHVFGGMKEDVSGPWGSPGWYREVSAVTGACMMVRRSIFEQIGGFDENYLLAFSDIEICVRARTHGYRVIYNPFVRLIHFEGKSRGHYIPKEDMRLGFKHLREMVARGDPCYNPNLSYAVKHPTLRRRSEPNALQRLEDILAMKANTGD